MVEQAALDLLRKHASSFTAQGDWVAKIDPETLSLNLDTQARSPSEALNTAVYVTIMKPYITLGLLDEIDRLNHELSICQSSLQSSQVSKKID